MGLADIEWRLYWDDDGNGSATVNLAGYVQDVRIKSGRKTQLQPIPPSEATIVLDNSDGRFSPDNAGGPYSGGLKLGRLVRLVAIHDGDWYFRFTGYITRWQLTSSIKNQQVIWTCEDLFGLFKNRLINVPVFYQMRLDYIIKGILDYMGPNTFDNTDVEEDITRFTAINAQSTVTQSSDSPFSGDYGVKCVTNGVATGEGIKVDLTAATSPGDRIDAPFWGICAAGVNLDVTMHDDVAGQIGAARGISLSSAWKREYGYASFPDNGSTSRWMEIETRDAAQAKTFYIDLVTCGLRRSTLRAVSEVNTATADGELVTGYDVLGVDLLQALAATEPKGMIFVRSTGNQREDIFFINETTSHPAGAAVQTFSDDGSDIPYHLLSYQQDIYDGFSEVLVRSLGDFVAASIEEVVWDVGEPLPTIPASTTRTFHVRYSQPAKLCSLTVTPAPASSSFKNYGAGADIEITAGGSPLVLTALYVTGKPYQALAEQSEVRGEGANPPAFPRQLVWDMPFQASESAEMGDECDRLKAAYDDPPPKRVKMVLRPKTDAVMVEMLDRELFERIHVENVSGDHATDLDADMWIEGRNDHMGKGFSTWETILDLEEAV